MPLSVSAKWIRQKTKTKNPSAGLHLNYSRMYPYIRENNVLYHRSFKASQVYLEDKVNQKYFPPGIIILSAEEKRKRKMMPEITAV